MSRDGARVKLQRTLKAVVDGDLCPLCGGGIFDVGVRLYRDGVDAAPKMKSCPGCDRSFGIIGNEFVHTGKRVPWVFAETLVRNPNWKVGKPIGQHQLLDGVWIPGRSEAVDVPLTADTVKRVDV